ncbi:hypothetical protein K2173_008455 [Erythroxylum novogranatense]|uniref:Uncharacterized protein n=1 Tax=Erythroxylum novogranatense TaxID=1862640 RepID=A0AAV8U938_9ROSI|nr:hypothetical protein K2173_008455 [Erythroxylum novogranatense]
MSLWLNWVVKIRLHQQKGLAPELLKYKDPIHCAHMIIHEEGLRGLWAGAAPTVMRNGTNQAAIFTAKNSFDVILWDKHEGDGKVLQPWQSMISGFLAGTVGTVCNLPFDVSENKANGSKPSGGDSKYKGLIHDCFLRSVMWAVADQITGFYEKRYIYNARRNSI